MQGHVDAAVAHLIGQGVPEADARRRVRLEMGDVMQEVEALGDTRPGSAIERLERDLRSAVRGLRRSPAVSGVIVLLIATGIAASSSIFTLVDRVLLKPVPLPAAEQVVRLYESNAASGVERTGVARGNLAQWRAQSRSFAAMAVAYSMGRTLTDGDRSEVVRVAQVSCDFGAVTGLAPLLGTAFTAEQCRAAQFSSAAAPVSADPVLLLGRSYWADRYGSDPTIVGRSILVDRRPFRVIGVVPDEMMLPVAGASALIAWELEQALPFDQRYTTAVARLAPGATLTRARAELARVAGELAQAQPATNRDWTVDVVPIDEDTIGGLRPVLGALMVAAALLLGIASTNVALLLLARGLARSHESAVHLALGGSSGRLLRQGLLEAGLLAAAGGTCGVGATYIIVSYLRGAWSDLPNASAVRPDPVVLAFALAATVVTAVFAGWFPALRQSRIQPISVLRGGRRVSGTRREGRVRNALVTAEIAMTVVLLVGAGLLIRTVSQLQASSPGFQARDVTVAPVFLDGERYRGGAASRQYYDDLFARLRALPGVVAVGGATTLPASEYGPDFARPVWPLASGADPRATRQAQVRIVTPGYLDALRIPMVRGRAFTDADGPDGGRVIAVSDHLAQSLWPGRDPVGEQLVVDYATAGTYPYTVVGVVGDIRFGGPRTAPKDEVYFPHAQRPYLILNVAVRAGPGITVSTAALRDVFRAVDPQKPPQGVYRLDELFADTFRRERLAMQLLVGFAAMAVLLAAFGIYGTIALRVREARREIGVRIAHGATPAGVVRWVAGEVGRLVVGGVVIGLGVAALGARAVQSLLFGVASHDPWTGATVAGVVVVVATVAAGVPAWRASRVDAVTALRAD